MDKEKIQNKIVQTYAEDMAHVIEDSKGGLVKKIIHGEEEHEEEKEQLSPQSKRNKLFMFFSFLFIVLAFGILAFFFSKRSAPTVEVAPQFSPLIFNDKSTFIEVKDFKKDQVIQSVLNEINTSDLKDGGVEGVYLTENKQIIGFKEFMTLIKGNFNPGSNGPFIEDNFLMGFFNNNGTRDFFILLKTRSIGDIFDSLHKWESKMFTDLHGFIDVPISADTQYLLTKNFQDGIIENKNARILWNNLGGQESKIVLAYIFADDNSVVITSDQAAAHEIVLRLASSKVKK